MSIVKFELNETQLALQLRSTLEQADSCYTKEYLPLRKPMRSYPMMLLWIRWKDSLLPNYCMLHSRVFAGTWIVTEIQ